MKKFAAAALVLVAVIGAVVFWLSGNLDGLIKSAMANYGSAMTQAKRSCRGLIGPSSARATRSIPRPR
jgi:hypothetical protein